MQDSKGGNVAKIHNAAGASGKDGWRTPLKLFKKLDKEFNFAIDVAADRYNTLAIEYQSKEDDALAAHSRWCENGPAWCNPPYGRGIKKWVAKGALESGQAYGGLVVMLLPASTDTKWFHEIVVPIAKQIRFLKGRLIFGGVMAKDGTVGKAPAPFPSMVVIFGGLPWWDAERMVAWDWRKDG
jgi:site-specific DNA-methyltransferase (adenine-specific)